MYQSCIAFGKRYCFFKMDRFVDIHEVQGDYSRWNQLDEESRIFQLEISLKFAVNLSKKVFREKYYKDAQCKNYKSNHHNF